jgi:hypothetical protein
MTNPFIISPQRRENDNPFVVRQGGFSAYEEEPDYLGRMLSRMQQVARVFEYSNPLRLPTASDPDRTNAYQQIIANAGTIKPAAAEAMKSIGKNIGSLFDPKSYEELGKKVSGYFSELKENPVDTIIESAGTAAGVIASLPV